MSVRVLFFFFSSLFVNSGKSYKHPPFPGHAAELPFVFHTLEDFVCTQEELQLADSASQFWGNFVKYGNPNGQSAEQGEGYCAEEECKVCDVALAQNLLISCLSLLLRLTDVYQTELVASATLVIESVYRGVLFGISAVPLH